MISPNGVGRVSLANFQIITWALCGVATLLFTSRVFVRLKKNGRLVVNDYLLAAALPTLFVGLGLVQSLVNALYQIETIELDSGLHQNDHFENISSKLVAAFEMLWLSIYLVKACFLAQFKFHKPPYAYVSVHLTRYYWACITLCTLALLFSISQPIFLCPNRGSCLYFRLPTTAPWEILINAVDIATYLVVTSIPLVLIYMVHFARTHTFINAAFKGLSICPVSIAAIRLAIQYDPGTQSVDYVSVTFWLVVEATLAITVASISSYRTVVLDYISKKRLKPSALPTEQKLQKMWDRARRWEAADVNLDEAASASPSDMRSDLLPKPRTSASAAQTL